MTRTGAPDTELRRTARLIGLQTAGLLIACLVVVAVLYVSVVRSQDEQMTTSLADAVATAGAGRGTDHDHDHDLREPREASSTPSWTSAACGPPRTFLRACPTST